MGVLVREARGVRGPQIFQVLSQSNRRFLGISDKDGNQLWTVTIFTKNVDAFITKARNQLKIYVRRVEYNMEAYRLEKDKRAELEAKIKVAEADLKKNCLIVYGALFECMMHLKTLRTHIESILRWGIPAKYCLGLVKV